MSPLFTGVSPRSIPLSPTDSYFACHDEYRVSTPLYFARRLDADALRRALEPLRSAFWPLAGRLTRGAGGPRIARTPGDPLPLQEIDASGTRLDPDDPDAAARLSAPIRNAPDQPLCRLALHQFATGSLLTVDISHALVDGFSLFWFLSLWARLAREPSALSRLWLPIAGRPDHRRGRLAPPPDPAPLDRDRLAERVFDETGYTWTGAPSDARPRAVRWETISFAPGDFGPDLADRDAVRAAGLSYHDLIAAALWRRVADRWHDGDPALRFIGSVDARRLDRRLRRRFGNAVAGSALSLRRAEILDGPLAALAARLRAARRGLDRERFQRGERLLATMRAQLGDDALRATSLIHPTRGLLVDDVSRIPLDHLDFGAGRPRLATPSPEIARIAMVFARPDDDPRGPGWTARLSRAIDEAT